MWIKIGIVLYLAVLGVVDGRHRQIPVWVLSGGGVLSVGIGMFKCIQEEMMWMEPVWGLLPGVFLLLIAWASKKAGYADGIVLMQLGWCMGWRNVLFLLCFSMLLLSGISVVLLLARKVEKETKMPYLTALSFTYLVWIILGG